MLTITKLKMWKDPGYTQGCVEVPPAGSKKLPAPDFTLATGQTLRPRKDSTLTALELPLSFTKVFEMSYLYIEASDGAGSIALFGWIESCERTATAEDAVLLRWTVDWWRSYSGSAVFGRGRITRCADSSYKRPYPVQPRKWKYSYSESLNVNSDPTYPYTVVVAYNEVEHRAEEITVPGTSTKVPVTWDVTTTKYCFWNCNTNSGQDTLTVDNVQLSNPSLKDVYNGNFDEMLGLNPEAITGVFVIPGTVWPRLPQVYGIVHGPTQLPQQARVAYVRPPSDAFVLDAALSRRYESNDMKRAVVVDPYGAVIGTLPWGYGTDHFRCCIDAGTIATSVRYLFTDSTEIPQALDQGMIKSVEDLVVEVPGIACPVNSNGWSSYVYSGRREYDIKMKETQRTSKAIDGIVNGALVGSIANPGIGTAVGAVAGAAGTLITSMINDDKIQELNDQLYSNQTSNMLIGAGGDSWTNSLFGPGGWYIVQLVADSVSDIEYSNNVSLSGYPTDMTVSSLSTFVSTGGALTCSELNLTGNIPPQAKQFIKSKLEKGVYIVENNPSGVVP